MAQLLGLVGHREQQQVGAGLAVGLAAPQRIVHAARPHRVGAGDDQEVRTAPGRHRFLHLGRHQLHRDHVLDPDVMVCALGHELVLDLDRREAGRLAHADRPVHVHGIAVAARAVEDQGQRRDGADIDGDLAHLGDVQVCLERDLLVPGRAAAEVARRKARRLGHPRHQRIENQRCGHRHRPLDQPRSDMQRFLLAAMVHRAGGRNQPPATSKFWRAASPR